MIYCFLHLHIYSEDMWLWCVMFIVVCSYFSPLHWSSQLQTEWCKAKIYFSTTAIMQDNFYQVWIITFCYIMSWGKQLTGLNGSQYICVANGDLDHLRSDKCSQWPDDSEKIIDATEGDTLGPMQQTLLSVCFGFMFFQLMINMTNNFGSIKIIR